MTIGNTHRLAGLASRGVIVSLLLLLSGIAPVRGDDAPLRFQSIEDALERSQADRQVTVVYFTATWCGWCAQMEQVTFRDPEVVKLGEAYNWARVDVDESQDVAGLFGVRGVPAVALLNADGELLKMLNGYQGPAPMSELLRAHRDAAEAPGELRRRIEQADDLEQRLEGDEVESAVLDAVTMLASGEAAADGRAARSILELDQRAWPALALALEDERLAVRAAAHELLRESTGHDLAYDAFADPPKRNAQAQAWRDWAASHTEEAKTNESEHRE